MCFIFYYKIFEELCPYILSVILMPGYDGKLTYLTVKTSEKLNMEHLYFTGFIILLYITTGHAQSTYLIT